MNANLSNEQLQRFNEFLKEPYDELKGTLGFLRQRFQTTSEQIAQKQTQAHALLAQINKFKEEIMKLTGAQEFLARSIITELEPQTENKGKGEGEK